MFAIKLMEITVEKDRWMLGPLACQAQAIGQTCGEDDDFYTSMPQGKLAWTGIYFLINHRKSGEDP